MARRKGLTDEQWAIIEPLIPPLSDGTKLMAVADGSILLRIWLEEAKISAPPRGGERGKERWYCIVFTF